MAKVTLAPEAIEDILEIYAYLLDRDGKEQAGEVLERLEKSALEKLSTRGKLPEELIPFGNNKIHAIQVAPLRIFYRAEPDAVFVLAVLDGRRNIAQVLAERLVR